MFNMCKIWKYMRIISAVFGAACLVPVFVLFALELFWPSVACCGGALLGFLLTWLFKFLQEKEEEKNSAVSPKGDFFHPLEKTSPEKEDPIVSNAPSSTSDSENSSNHTI